MNQTLVLPPLDERDREEQRYAVYAAESVQAWECQHGRRTHAKPTGRSTVVCVEGARLGESCAWEIVNRREIASTPTLEGVGPMLAHLREEGQITDDHRIGILDRVERTWLLNPWAKGRL